MNLLERVLTLLRANLNTVIEKAEDPEQVLRQLQLDMRNQLVQVKTQVATALAEGHRLQQRSQERKAEGDKWLKKAEVAVQQGNDESARDALTRYNDLNHQIGRYQQQRKEQEQLVSTMRNALRQLEAKISEVETTLDLLSVRKRNALIQQRVFEALNKSANPKDKERTHKVQDAVADAEARAQALAELHRRDLENQLEQVSKEQEIEKQLRTLKAKKQTQRQEQPPLLPGAHAQTAPLLPPQPQLDNPVRQTGPLSRRPDLSAELSNGKDLDVERLRKLLNLPQAGDA